MNYHTRIFRSQRSSLISWILWALGGLLTRQHCKVSRGTLPGSRNTRVPWKSLLKILLSNISHRLWLGTNSPGTASFFHDVFHLFLILCFIFDTIIYFHTYYSFVSANNFQNNNNMHYTGVTDYYGSVDFLQIVEFDHWMMIINSNYWILMLSAKTPLH